MNKLTLLFLTMLLGCLPLSMNADNSKDDETRYLVGAVPEIDGKVVFSKEFQIPGMDQNQIFERINKWMDARLQNNKNEKSRVVYTDMAKGSIAGIGEEWIVFKSTALSLDRTQINYQITVSCQPERCIVELEKIRFTYRENEKYTAEEWITDKYALNKDKTKLVRGLAKWRIKTVDFADQLFKDVTTALSTTNTAPKEEKATKKSPASNVNAGPVVIQAATVVAVSKEVSTSNAVKESQEAPGYVEANLKQIPGDIFALMGNSKLVITIGKDAFNMTTMTANAGGAIGYQSGKAVAYCTLSPEQSHDAMEKANSYTLKIFKENETTPAAIIECKKLPQQTAAQAGQPHTYVGEILKLLIKK